MKRHVWGREVKYGTGHFRRYCDRPGCKWAMEVVKPRGGRTRLGYTRSDDGSGKIVDELPECDGKPQPG